MKTESDLCVPDRKQSGSVPSAFPAVSLTTPQSHLVPQLYHRTARGMSSLKTSSLNANHTSNYSGGQPALKHMCGC